MDMKPDSALLKPLLPDDPVVGFADALGAALVNTDLYGLQHKLTIRTLETCFDRLCAVLSRSPRIDVAFGEDGQLLLNKSPLADVNPRLLALKRRLTALKMTGFVLKPGIDAHEFMNLMIYLSKSRLGDQAEGGPRTLEEAGLPHVSATRTVVTQIEDDEPTPESDNGKLGGIVVEQILAFLSGNAGTGTAESEVAEAVRNTDAESLAKLILETTSVRQAAAGIAGGESLGELVVGCLRRTFNALNSGPAAKTAKGKKDVRRTLAVLEEKVLDRLRQMAIEGLEGVESAVSDEFDGMKEEIEIEDVVAQYMRSRRTEEEKEKKLLRYMRRKRGEAGAPELQAHLEAEGLRSDEWNSLVVKSVRRDAPGSDASDGSCETSLSVLLAELTRVIESHAPPEKVEQAVHGIDGSFRRVVKRMAAEVEGLEAAPRRTPAERQALQGSALPLLRELVQELCQPLTVMNAAVRMTLESHSQEMNRSQQQLLSLAVECSEDAHKLMKRLVELAGVPAGFHPNEGMQAELRKDETIRRNAS